MTALIDRLAAAGYVERVPVPGDRRATGIRLPPATWAAFARVYRPLGERVWAATAELPQRDALAAAMATVTGAFDEVRDRLAQPA